MQDLSEYRASDQEQGREASLMSLVPRNRASVLDIGARDGHYSRLLTKRYKTVIALDLAKPPWEIAGVTTMAGDACNLHQFPDASVDTVFCAEVLEHIDDLEKACLELARVARHEVIVGVPYMQDIRVGRTTCHKCRNIEPPWGHVNSFDEDRLRALFPTMLARQVDYTGESNSATTDLAMRLMDRAGNPWGTYNREEGCRKCGLRRLTPPKRGLWQRAVGAYALWLQQRATLAAIHHPNWVHVLFVKG